MSELAYAATPALARVALARDQSLELTGVELSLHADDVGAALVAVGRWKEALPFLRHIVGRCNGWTHAGSASTEAIFEIFSREHSLLHLGEALEGLGDVPGACAEYGTVMKEWKDAKPRSITLEKARARAAALHCGPHDTAPRSGDAAP